ncbi:hypothetical protein H4S07_006259, partial [Coemansia furcata]
MAHINDLPAAVITQILFKATAISAKTLSEWKTNLPLVAVCRAWTELAQPFVFYHVYVELTSSLWLDILPFAYSNTRPFWTSNAELIISRGCILMARRLTIELADVLTPECLRSIALDILKLDCVDWQHINALTITDDTSVYPYYEYTTDIDKASEEDMARTVQYFGRNMRSLASSILTGISGETLGVLKLYDIPRNFAWHHFRYDTFDQPIVFRQLTILHFYYQSEDKGKALTEAEIREKVALGALNCDKLCFPALRELRIQNCTPDCDLLYADLPLPELKKLTIFGSINSIHH